MDLPGRTCEFAGISFGFFGIFRFSINSVATIISFLFIDNMNATRYHHAPSLVERHVIANQHIYETETTTLSASIKLITTTITHKQFLLPLLESPWAFKP